MLFCVTNSIQLDVMPGCLAKSAPILAGNLVLVKLNGDLFAKCCATSFCLANKVW